MLRSTLSLCLGQALLGQLCKSLPSIKEEEGSYPIAAQSLECLQIFLSDDVRELDNNMVSQGTWGYVYTRKKCLGVCMNPDICICLCPGL